MKKLLINMLCFFLIDGLFRWLNRHKILIVMYHGVTDADLPFSCWWQFPKNMFLKQMEFLNKHYRILTLREVCTKIAKNESLPTYAAVITFDDGYANNAHVAFPILNDLNLPATIFVTTGNIGTDNLLWPDKLYCAFANAKATSLNMEDQGFGTYSLNNMALRANAFNVFQNKIKAYDIDKKNMLIDIAVQRLGYSSTNKGKIENVFSMMSWENIKKLNETGLIEFGAHSVSHEIFTQLSTQEKQKEIIDSCSILKEKIKKKNIAFAYPNGNYDEECVRILKKENVYCGLTVDSGLNSKNNNIYQLKRIGIGNDITMPFFRLLTSGFWDAVLMFRVRK